MNKVKQLSRRNIKLIIALLIFVSIGAGVTYSATTYLYNSNVIGYDNSDSGLTSTDVQGALDELYNTCVNSTNCPDGYVCHEKINVLPMFEENAVRDDISSTYVTSSTGIDFGKISSNTNGKGIYMRAGTELTGHPIYYYRGNVDNNNVLFANFCWKIVRTTDTGGIMLVYNGLPSGNTCPNKTGEATQLSSGIAYFNNPFSGDSKYIGYTYDNSVSSTIKTIIDNWYASNMTSYTNYLEDTIWCNDRSVVDASMIYYGSYNWLYQNKIPSLNCLQDADKYTVSDSIGNGELTYPVALLTGAELMLAGAIWSTSNTSFYLYTNRDYWTMTPFYNYKTGGSEPIYLKSNGSITYMAQDGSTSFTTRNGVRPTISLKPSTTFAYGDGTANSPYVVATS